MNKANYLMIAGLTVYFSITFSEVHYVTLLKSQFVMISTERSNKASNFPLRLVYSFKKCDGDEIGGHRCAPLCDLGVVSDVFI